MTVEKPKPIAHLSDPMLNMIRRMAHQSSGRIEVTDNGKYRSLREAEERLLKEGYATRSKSPAGKKHWITITPKAAMLLGYLSRYDQDVTTQRAKEARVMARGERIHHAANDMYDVIKTIYGVIGNTGRRNKTEVAIFKAVSRIVDHVETDTAD